MKHLKNKTCFILVLLLLELVKPSFAWDLLNGKNVNVKLLFVFNKNFPIPQPDEAQKITLEAKKIAGYKFNLNIDFEVVKTIESDMFFQRCKVPFDIQQFEKETKAVLGDEYHDTYFDIWNGKVNNGLVRELEQTLSREGEQNSLFLERIKSFFQKSEAKNITTYFNAAKKILDAYVDKIKLLKKIKINGRPMLVKERHQFNSADYWKTLSQRIKGVDMVITNEPIVMDRIGGNLHVILNYAAVNGGGTFVSIFPTYSIDPFFTKKRGLLTGEQRPYVIADILVHELGHYVGGLGDTYLPQYKGCIMYVGPDALPGWERYKLITSTPACESEIKAIDLGNSHKFFIQEDEFNENHKQFFCEIN